MISNAITGMLVVYVLYLLRLFPLPVAIGLSAAFLLAAIIDIYLERR